MKCPNPKYLLMKTISSDVENDIQEDLGDKKKCLKTSV